MKFGRRRKEADSPTDTSGVIAAPEPSERVADSWTAPSPAAPAPSAEAPPFYDPPEAVVEGEAVEIAPDPTVAARVPPEPAFGSPPTAGAGIPAVEEPDPVISWGATPATPELPAMPFPAATEPIAVVSPGSEPELVASLGAAAETFASGHGPSPAPAWPEGIQELAAERPEMVVGAAFVGGILAAMILRRLGN